MSNDNMLSQDEIDALLKGNEPDTSVNLDKQPTVEDYLSSIECDALGEIGNISYGNSATALSTLLKQKVTITTPSVSLVLRNTLEEEFPVPFVAVEVEHTSGFTGTNLLVIKQNDAAIIADLMLGGDGLNPSEMLDEIQLSAVKEAMNQMMGSSATSMSTIFNKRVNISPPSINLMDLRSGEGEGNIPDSDKLIKISFRLIVGDIIDSTIMQLLPISFAKNLASNLLNPGDGTSNSFDKKQSKHHVEEEKSSTLEDDPKTYKGTSSQDSMAYSTTHKDLLNEDIIQQQTPSSTNFSRSHKEGPTNSQLFGSSAAQRMEPNVQPAVFSDFEEQQPVEPDVKNLDILMDVPLQVTVELGRTTRSVKEILELSSGSIIELDKLAGEPVDIMINNRLIAKGEVVVIDENFGVRVTDIISQSDRIKKLR